jgi:hypothetical protein
MTPLEAAEAALAADRDHNDPAIWITRLPDADILSRARLRRRGRKAASSGASPSR